MTAMHCNVDCMKPEYIASIVILCALVVVLIVVVVLATATYKSIPFIPIVFDLTTGAVFMDVLASNRRLRSVVSISSPVSYFSTQSCPTCVFQPYDPSLSGNYTNLNIQDSITFGVDGVVQGVMGTDTVTFQQNTKTNSACGYNPSFLKPALPFIVPDFLLLAATKVTKAPLNQVGLSPLQFADSSTSTSRAVHDAVRFRKYESSILEDLRATGGSVQWSLLLKPFASQMWLGRKPPSNVSCPVKAPMAYTPLLPALPHGASPFFADKGRYYAVAISNIQRVLPDGSRVAVEADADAQVPVPRVAIITLSQPLVVFPQSKTADAFLGTTTTNLQGLAVTFSNGPTLTIQPGASVWSYGGSGLAPIYGALPLTDTKVLSSQQDVIILGCMAFQNTLMHFDLDKQVFGLAELQGGPL